MLNESCAIFFAVLSRLFGRSFIDRLAVTNTGWSACGIIRGKMTVDSLHFSSCVHFEKNSS